MPVWRYEIGGTCREARADAAPAEHRARHLPPAPRRGPVRLELRPALHFRPHEGSVHERDRRALRDHRRRGPLRARRRRAGYPPLRLKVHGRRATFTLDGAAIAERPLPRGGRARLRGRGRAVEPGLLQRRPRAGDERDAGRLDRALGDDRRALAREAAAAAERERRARLLAARRSPRARDGVGAELVLAADQFVITPSAAREDAARARAAGRRGRARSSPAITGSPTGAATR